MNTGMMRVNGGMVLVAAFCAAASGQPRVAAHRGASLMAPENTLSAFAEASNAADMVEFDVRQSQDGVLVAMHDEDVARTTDGTGAVAELTLATLKSFVVTGSFYNAAFAGERIPTLTESVSLIKSFATPLLDCKTGTASNYVELLRSLDMVTNVVLMNFDWKFLDDVRQLEPALQVMALGQGAFKVEFLTNLQARGISNISWSAPDITTAEVDMVHAAGVEIYVYVVNGPAVPDALAMNVDGMITDDPWLARDLRSGYGAGSRVIDQDMISCWTFNEPVFAPSNLEVRDVKGRNPGAWHGVNDMPRQANALGAAFGDALALDGGPDYVAVPSGPSLDIGTNHVTLSMWVKLFQPPSAMAESFGSLYDAANDSYVMYLDRSSKELRFKVVDAQGYAARPGIPESRLVMGAWHHVVGVYDGNAGSGFGRTSIYLDGRLADTHIGADGGYGWHMQGIVRPGQSAAMGRNGTDDHGRLACVMDDVALWRRALDGGDVRWIYESGLQGTPLRRLMARLAFEQVVGGWDGSALRLQGQMEYGMTVTNLQFLVSDRVDGAFTPVAGGQVHDLGDNRFEFEAPIAADGAVFYKIVRP
jgi:glycerophosphoryl diester phosphodiesterase